MTEKQSELVTRAQQSGVLSLALRSIGDSDGMPIAKNFPNIGAPEKAAVVRPPLTVYRYGILRGESAGGAPGPAPAEASAAEAPAPQQTASTEGAGALESPR